MYNKLLRSVMLMGALFAFCAGTAMAQSGTIEGTVTDPANSEPVINANVFIPSLSKGAATDADGNFTIANIPYGSYKLRISYIGYTTKNIDVSVNQATTTVNIDLRQSVSQLEDVVVTAYGVEKQINELPYSAQTVETEKLTQSGNDNFISAFSGRVAGLQVQASSGVGASTDVVLRGFNSLTGNNQALFVVDGVPYSNNRFNTASQEAGFSGYDYGNTAVDINPDNIASVTVLKGPAAAALYGSRASNGAIVIETKQGVAGQESVDVSYTTSVGVSRINKNTFPEYQTQYGSGYGGAFLDGYDANGDGMIDNNVSDFTADASMGPRFDPSLNVYQWDAFYPNSPNFQTATPWVAADNDPSDFFETGVNLKNSILVNGGISDGGYYNIGYTQNNTNGVLPNSNLDEYKFNLKAGYQVTDDLLVSGKINFARTEGLGRPGRGYNSLLSNFRQWWSVNVDIEEQQDAYYRNRQNISWNPTAALDGPFYWNNPYFQRFENFQTDERNRYTGNGQFQYSFFDWLSLTGRVAIDNYDQLIEERLNTGSVSAAPFSATSGYLRRNQTYTEYNYDALLNFDRQLTQDLSIDGVLGANIRRTYITGISAQTNGGLVVSDLFALNNSVEQILYPNETDYRLGVNGYFINVNADYRNFLNLSLTGRRDKSSSLPEDENVYYYPSASAGFTFSEFIDIDWFSFGKIRGSWSEVGKTADPYSLINNYARAASNFGSTFLYSLPSTLSNANLKPERTKAWEIGLQLGFLNDRIYFDATYYDQNSIDQILPITVSAASGFTSRFINAGNIENRGLELTFQATPVSTNDFSWNFTANYTRNENQVKQLAEGIDYYEFVGPQGGVSIGAEEGGTYGAIRGSDFVYHENGQPIVDEETGFYRQTSSSNNTIGEMIPDWRGGFNNQFDYKNFSLSFLIDVSWGGDIFSLDQYYGEATGLYKNTVGLNDRGNPFRDPVSEGGGIVLDGVNEDGEPNETYAEGQFPGAFGYNNSPDARYVYDASYVKLREVGFTYRLPNRLLSQLGIIDSANFSVTGRNLWIIHKNLPNADPEQSLGASNIIGGYQGGEMPAVRNVTFNLKLNF